MKKNIKNTVYEKLISENSKVLRLFPRKSDGDKLSIYLFYDKPDQDPHMVFPAVFSEIGDV